MKKTIGVVVFLVLFIGVPLSASAMSITGVFKPGDTMAVRYPQSGTAMALFEKPKFVRWTLFDPAGEVIFEEDHALTYLRETVMWGVAWEFYDEYSLRVPAFATPGTWKISGRVYSEFLWVIEDPGIFTLEYTFTVKEVGFLENLLAPCYFTWDMGLIGGRVSGSLPFHPYLVLIIIGMLVAVIVLMRVVVNVALPEGGGKKK